MRHLDRLGFQVIQVVFVGGGDGDAFDDLYAEFFQGVDFLGVVGDKADGLDLQAFQDQRRHAVFALVGQMD